MSKVNAYVSEIGDWLAKFGSLSVILPIFVFGTVLYDPMSSSIALCFFFVAEVINLPLERLFRRLFRSGSSFPDRFIHAFTAFYLSLFHLLPRASISTPLILLLVLECGISLYRGRSDFVGILAGIGCAIGEIWAFVYLQTLFPSDIIATAIVIFCLTMLLVFVVIEGRRLEDYVLRDALGITGTLVSLRYLYSPPLSSFTMQLVAIVLIGLGVFLSFWLIEQIGRSDRIVLQLPFLFIPAVVFGVVGLVAKEGHRLPFK
jgi:hypothetical protein